MNIDQFWDIVGRVNAAAPGDMDAKCALLADALRQLSREEVRSFASHFSDCYFLAYQWEIWDAAWLIKGRCSDDKFSDFRATLISLGRAPFEAALANADSLADFNLDPAWATYEGYQYVAGAVCEEKGGERVGDGRQHPREPAGSACPEWEMAAKFPKLAARHGHHDSDYLYLKEREEKRIRDEEQAGEERARQQQKGQNTHVRVCLLAAQRGGQQEKPEHGGGGDQNHAGQADPVTRQMNERGQPAAEPAVRLVRRHGG